MKVSVLFVIKVKLRFNGHAIHMMLTDTVLSLFFKLTLIFKNQLVHKIGHAFYHDHKTVTVGIHLSDVPFAEVPTVKDKPNVLVSIALCLTEHKLKLRYVCYTPKICLVEQRL